MEAAETTSGAAQLLPDRGGGSSSFVGEVAVYFAVKIVTSLDDLVWLSPFVVIAAGGDTPRHSNKAQVFIIYTAICLLISLAALVLEWLAVGGLTSLLHLKHEDENDDDDSSDQQAARVLNVVAGIGIALLAFYEWKNGGETDDEDAIIGDDNQQSDEQPHDGGECGGVPTETTSLLEQQQVFPTAPQRRRHLLVDLLIVGIFGQLDTLVVFFSVLASRPRVRVAAVAVGSLLAAAVIILFAYCITLFRPFTRFLQKVPLWVILCVIAAYVLLHGVLAF